MSDNVTEKLKNHLAGLEIAYREVQHEETTTSEASARARDEPLEVGGKAILLKTDDVFRLFVLSAPLRVDSAAIRKQVKAKKIRFASRGELLELTGLVPGSVPPFGRPVLPFELFVDPSVLANDRVAFNAGSLRCSIIMSIQDYVAAAKPKVVRFAKTA